MAKDGIYLDIDPIEQAKGQAQNLQGEVETLRQQVQQIKSALNWQVLAKENIDGNLQMIVDDLNSQAEFLKTLQDVLVKAEQSAEEGNTTITSWVAQLMLKIKGILGVTEAVTAAAVIGGVIGAALGAIGNLLRSGNGSVAPTSTGTGSESTNVSYADSITQGTREERIVSAQNDLNTKANELQQARREKGKDPTYEGVCPALVFQQLKRDGLVTGAGGESVDFGKDYARSLANKGVTATGATCTGYSSFDEMLSSRQEPITNVVCSWNPGGNFQDSAGHTMLISRIEDGNVYFIDNCKGTTVRTSGDRHLVPQCMSIQEFKNFYYKKSNNPSGVTVISK